MSFSKRDLLSTFVDESVMTLNIPVQPNQVYVKNCHVFFEGDEVKGRSLDRTSEQDADPSLFNLICAKGNEFLRISVDLTSEAYVHHAEDDEISISTIKSPKATLPDTLKLLTEVNYRLLGELPSDFPHIVKVHDDIASKTPASFGSDFQFKELGGESEEQFDEWKKYTYLDLVNFAEHFVDDIIKTAKKIYPSELGLKYSKVSFSEPKPQNITWPTIEEFTEGVGLASIERYISYTFNLAENWKYKSSFISTHSDLLSDFFVYEVKFGLPTNRYPIPQATVSIWFTIEVSNVIPMDEIVSVTFKLESLRRVMKPGEVEVSDKMLLSVLYMKLEVMKQITF